MENKELLERLINRKHELDNKKMLVDSEYNNAILTINRITKFKDLAVDNMELFKELKKVINEQEAFYHKVLPVISLICDSKCRIYPENIRSEMCIKDNICPFACICDYLNNGIKGTAKNDLEGFYILIRFIKILVLKDNYKR